MLYVTLIPHIYRKADTIEGGEEERRNHGGRAKDVPFGVDRDFDFEFYRLTE